MNTERSAPQAAINVTPMIDVLLVLLIVFIAIAPVGQFGLDAAVPQNSMERVSAAPENPVILEIGEDGSYRVDSEAVAHLSLHDRLAAVFARRRERILFVKVADSVEYSAVAAAIDTAYTVRIERVALMPR